MKDVRASLEVGFPGGTLPERFLRYRGVATRAIPAAPEFPYEDAQFDAVLMDGAAVSPRTVREAHRVLRPEGRLFFTVPEKTKSQDGFTLPDIYSIVREGYNIIDVVRPAWWLFGRRGRTITICAQKKNWRSYTNTYRPYVTACFAFFALATLCLRAGISSSDAIAIVLNSRSSVSARTFAVAKDMVEREAAKGKSLQQFVVGVTTDDKKLARKYLAASEPRIRRMAEEGDNPFAWYLLAMERNDITMLKKAADGGNVQALNALGTTLMQEAFGRSGISSNEFNRIMRNCYEYFRQAAAQGDPNGFINLGTCCLRGFGCKVDLAMAFSCFRSAATAEPYPHPEGMDNLSACYQLGHGVKKNEELSTLWAMRARAARGDELAEKWLKDRK